MSLDRSKLCTELKVAKKIGETADTFSFVLQIPDNLKDKFKYRAGQFVTFFVDVLGEEVRRSYSLASAPESDTDFKVTIKRVPGGKLSNYMIDHVHEGDSLWTTPPAGLFVLPPESQGAKLVFYAAGSGITPIISMIKSALHQNAATSCVLLFQNKEEASVIFRSELDGLTEKFKGRIAVEHILSQPSANWAGLRGRADRNIIRDVLTKNLVGIRAIHFMCGPEGFMQGIEATLKEMNVDAARIKKESFLSGSERSTAQNVGRESSPSPAGGVSFTVDDDSIYIGDKSKKSTPGEVTATFDGETCTVTAVKNMTVLESLLEAGKNPPYSCMDGACMACLAKVTDGLVYQNDMGILTDDNIAAGECLTCQARPASKSVTVNFEIF